MPLFEIGYYNLGTFAFNGIFTSRTKAAKASSRTSCTTPKASAGRSWLPEAWNKERTNQIQDAQRKNGGTKRGDTKASMMMLAQSDQVDLPVLLFDDPKPVKPELCCWLLFCPKKDILEDQTGFDWILRRWFANLNGRSEVASLEARM